MSHPSLKPLVWVGSSLHDLRACPEPVQKVMGYALFLAQCGGRHPAAKRLKGDLGGLVEVVEDHDRSSYRAVYVARLPAAIYVLHVFQKKSTRGIGTARHDVELIKSRLRWVEHHTRAAEGEP